MMQQNSIRCKAGNKFTKLQEKRNYLMYVADTKIFAKNEKEIETLK